MVRNKLAPRLLWVEGKDDSAVVQSLCNQYGVPETFRVVDKEGEANVVQGLPLQLRRLDVECLGVVLDADTDAHARWASIRDVLVAEGYPDIPLHASAAGMIVSAPDLPRFGAWIMPDNVEAGMLEDFAASLIGPGDFLWNHASASLDAIPDEHRRFSPGHRSKALIHTWLAWQESPGSPMGQAITKGDLDARAPLAEAFVAWLNRLMIG
jgi:hypothetical protein